MLMYNKNMSMEKGRLKGFTIIETMLFLALTGLMLVGALVGLGTNLSRQRYKDSVQDVVTLIRNQYDYVTRVQIDQRDGDDMCEIVSGSGVADTIKNKGRGRSKCDVYGVALVFGLDDEGDLDAGSIIQSTSILGKDIKALEDEYRAYYPQKDPREKIEAMSDLELMKELSFNNVIESVQKCRPVNLLERKVLNWGSKIEHTAKDTVKKGVVLIIRSPRDGTVHTYTYDFSMSDTINVPDYGSLKDIDKTCMQFTAGSFDINTLLGASPAVFTTANNFDLCITSDDLTGTYGKRRMIRIAADGHNSSAVALIDEDSGDDICEE